MPVTYAAVPLTPPNSGLDQFVYWHDHVVEEFDFPGYNTTGIDHLPIPSTPPQDTPRVGAWRWPTGASRWAVCHLICTGEQLAAVRTAVGSSGTPQPLEFFDGTTTVPADMYFLNARPISQRGAGEFYLLTLVDVRWYWWQQGDQPAPVVDSSTTWTSYITALFASVGVTPAIDSIPAAYGKPQGLRWTRQYKPLPVLIDAACQTVGLRVVRALDGSVACQSYATAAAADAANWTTYKDYVLAGGQLAAADIARSVPASVSVVFPGDAAQKTVKTLSGLALTQYAGATGVAGKDALVVGDTLAWDSGAFAAYATQAATDYYLWRLSVTDQTLRAFWPRPVTGLDDFQEYAHSPSQLVTRTVRMVYSDANQYGDRAPAGFTYRVRLTATDSTSWKAVIRKVLAGAETDGPQLGFGDDAYVLWAPAGSLVGDYGVAAPDPLVPNKWLFTPSSGFVGFHAELTSTDGTGWNFYKWVLNGSRVYVHDGAEVTGYKAVALAPDTIGKASWKPRKGMNVWMKYDPAVDDYEFLSRYENVTEVCITKTYVSGVLTDAGVIVQTTLNDGTESCVTNPVDCCEPLDGVDCDGTQYPEFLCVKITPSSFYPSPGACGAVPSDGVFVIAGPASVVSHRINWPIAFTGTNWSISGTISAPCSPSSWTTGPDADHCGEPQFNGGFVCSGSSVSYDCGLDANETCTFSQAIPVEADIELLSGVKLHLTPYSATCATDAPAYYTLGTATGSGVLGSAVATIGSVSVPADCTLIVKVLAAIADDSGTHTLDDPTVTFDDGTTTTTLALISSTEEDDAGVVDVGTYLYALHFGANATGTITVTGACAPANVAVGVVAAASYQTVARTADVRKTGTGLASTPDLGTSGTTSAPVEIVQAGVSVYDVTPPGGFDAWSNGFSAGQTATLALLGGTLRLLDGYKVLSTATTFDAKTTPAHDAWSGAAVSFY